MKILQTSRNSLYNFLGEEQEETGSKSSFKILRSFKNWRRQNPSFSPDDPGRVVSVLRHLERHYRNFALNTADEIMTAQVVRHDLRTNFGEQQLTVPVFLEEAHMKASDVVMVNYMEENAAQGMVAQSCDIDGLVFLERFDLSLLLMRLNAKERIHLEPDQALKIEGVRHWSTFNFTASSRDDIPDDWLLKIKMHGQPKLGSTIIATDCMQPKFKKYNEKNLKCLIQKAYAGFMAAPGDEVCTTHWGCGAGKKNSYNVMLCVQVMAATLARKKLRYFIGDRRHRCEKGMKLVELWTSRKIGLRAAFYDLVTACDTDPDFETFYDPGDISTSGFFKKKQAGSSGYHSSASLSRIKEICSDGGVRYGKNHSHEALSDSGYGRKAYGQDPQHRPANGRKGYTRKRTKS